MKRKSKNYYSISEVAKMFEVNEWTIRLWINRFDILKPLTDKEGNLSLSAADVNKIGLICRLRDKGITIKEIRKRPERESGDEESVI